MEEGVLGLPIIEFLKPILLHAVWGIIEHLKSLAQLVSWLGGKWSEEVSFSFHGNFSKLKVAWTVDL